MPTLDITDDQADRIEALREELAAAHAGPYASVDREDAVAYLLDLAAAVDDPDRLAEPTTGGDGSGGDAVDGSEADEPFDRDLARELLTARNRRHTDPDPDDPMDLSEVAAAFDVTGRSGMTKAELVDAILDAAERLAADPFARVDIDLGDEAGDGTDSAETEPTETEIESAETESDETDPEDASDDGDDGGSDDDESAAGGDDGASDDESAAGDDGTGQLNAMMSLLDTHADKWREGDGDARYEVDLPDGSVETARTKDDVRALLFKNY